MKFTRLLFVLLLCQLTAAAQQRPNIIFILSDDHRWDALGAAGNKIIQTPNLDRLAKKGVLFKNAYVTTSICCVSRASILSGQYQSRHTINNFTTDFTPAAVQNTYPFLLKKEGYTIGFVGKYGVGTKPPAGEFDYWSCTPKIQPDYFLRTKDGRMIHNTDSVSSDLSIFLDKFAGKAPFCLSVGFKAPHELDGNPPEFPTQPRFDRLYQSAKIPEPETADPKYWKSFPAFFRTDTNIARERWKPLLSTYARYQETVKRYYRLITGVDEAVGKMVAQLKRLGIEKNTVIIFMGDNGFFLGEHGMEGKWYGYEESVRVPLIVYDPRYTTVNGRSSSRIALNVDIAPTILSLAHAAVPSGMQGGNLFDHLMSGTPVRKDFFYEHHYETSPKLPQSEGVIGGRFKYLNYIEHGYEELYDIAEDPHEKNNLVHDARYSKTLAALRGRYAVLKESVR